MLLQLLSSPLRSLPSSLPYLSCIWWGKFGCDHIFSCIFCICLICIEDDLPQPIPWFHPSPASWFLHLLHSHPRILVQPHHHHYRSAIKIEITSSSHKSRLSSLSSKLESKLWRPSVLKQSSPSSNVMARIFLIKIIIKKWASLISFYMHSKFSFQHEYTRMFNDYFSPNSFKKTWSRRLWVLIKTCWKFKI